MSSFVPPGNEWLFFDEPRLALPNLKSPPAQRQAITLTVELKHITPRIWRRLRVPGSMTLEQFHDLIQLTMGWTDSHLHNFRQRGRDQAPFLTHWDILEGETHGIPEDEVQLSQLLTTPGDAFEYDYDFGDGWEHRITAEKIEPAPQDDPVVAEGGRGEVLTGRRACPPEDCGGVGGYAEALEAVRATDPDADQRRLRAWLDGWGPEDFDPQRINRVLRAMEHTVPLHNLRPELVELLESSLDAQTLQAQITISDCVQRTPTDDEVEAVVAVWRTYLQQIGDGVNLTQAGWLPPRVVTELVELLGLPKIYGKYNRESNVIVLQTLREQLRAAGLIKVRKGTLSRTQRGRAACENPRELFRCLVSTLPRGSSEAEVVAGWLYLIGVAAEMPSAQLGRWIAEQMSKLGWQQTHMLAGGMTMTRPVDSHEAYLMSQHTRWALALHGVQMPIESQRAVARAALVTPDVLAAQA